MSQAIIGRTWAWKRSPEPSSIVNLRPGGHLPLRVAAYDWLRGEHDITFAQGTLDGLFRRVLASEAPLASRSGLPFGLSVLALARKPTGA